jgi:AcrR family transcriptional regulator
VARRVGVTEPVIFQNFGSKAALFAAVLERAAAQVQATLDELAATGRPASGLLAHVLAGPAHGGPEHAGAAYGILFADAATLVGEPDLAGPARAASRAVAAHLTGVIRHAQAAGEVAADADPAAAAWLLLSVLAARPLRAAAMPPALEARVTDLAARALAPPD